MFLIYCGLNNVTFKIFLKRAHVGYVKIIFVIEYGPLWTIINVMVSFFT